MNLDDILTLKAINAGGPGSGCRGDDCGRKKGPKKDKDRVKRAKATYVAATFDIVKRALDEQGRVAKAIGGKEVPDHQPFDVIKGKVAIEVKAKIVGKKNTITMHPDSLREKKKSIIKNKYTAYTVCIDKRGPKDVVYWRDGVGSFKLKNMNIVKDIKDLRGILK